MITKRTGVLARGRRRARAAAGLAAVALCTVAVSGPGTGAAVADATPSASAATAASAGVANGAIRVLGSARVQAQRSAAAGAGAALVLGVRRVPGATVLYYAYGLPSSSGAKYSWYERTEVNVGSYKGILGPLVVDLVGGKAYAALQKDGTPLGTPNALQDGKVTAGTFQVLYAVMPQLPAGVRTVQVVLGQGEPVPDIPVEDGLLEPATGDPSVPLGTGWPTVDLSQVGAADPVGNATFPVLTRTSTIDNSLSTRTNSDRVDVDLSADVLFEVDKATLTAKATSQLQQAAAQVNTGAKAGAIAITGHTDSTGTPAHNLDLSQRRAQAVAAALKPLLTLQGLTFTVAGKGETQPVADNGTAQGRQQNRRVTISFQKAGS